MKKLIKSILQILLELVIAIFVVTVSMLLVVILQKIIFSHFLGL